MRDDRGDRRPATLVGYMERWEIGGLHEICTGEVALRTRPGGSHIDLPLLSLAVIDQLLYRLQREGRMDDKDVGRLGKLRDMIVVIDRVESGVLLKYPRNRGSGRRRRDHRVSVGIGVLGEFHADHS